MRVERNYLYYYEKWNYVTTDYVYEHTTAQRMTMVGWQVMWCSIIFVHHTVISHQSHVIFTQRIKDVWLHPQSCRCAVEFILQWIHLIQKASRLNIVALTRFPFGYFEMDQSFERIYVAGGEFDDSYRDHSNRWVSSSCETPTSWFLLHQRSMVCVGHVHELCTSPGRATDAWGAFLRVHDMTLCGVECAFQFSVQQQQLQQQYIRK